MRSVKRVLGVNAGRGWNDCRIQRGGGPGIVGRDAGRWRHDGIERETAARLIPRYVGWCGCDHVGGKAGSLERRVQTFGRSRAGIRLEGEQIGDGFAGRWEFKVGSVDDLRRKPAAACHVNGLSAVMRFLASGAAGGTGLGAAEIFGARQFVAGVVDHFVRFQLCRRVGAKLVNLPRENDNDEQQEQLQ